MQEQPGGERPAGRAEPPEKREAADNAQQSKERHQEGYRCDAHEPGLQGSDGANLDEALIVLLTAMEHGHRYKQPAAFF